MYGIDKGSYSEVVFEGEFQLVVDKQTKDVLEVYLWIIHYTKGELMKWPRLDEEVNVEVY